MMGIDTPGTEAAPARERAFRQRVRTHLRDLRRALTGPDRPPPFRWLRSPALLGVGLAFLVALALVAVLAVSATPIFEPLLFLLGGPGTAVVAMLVVAILLLALRRPLVAWRITWLIAAYETAVGIWVLWLPHQFGPPLADIWPGGGLLPLLGFSPLTLVLLLTACLFLVAASHDDRVVFWAWLVTVALVVASWSVIAILKVVPAPTGPPIPLAPGSDILVGHLGAPQYFGHPLLVLATAIVPVSLGTLAGLLLRHQLRTRRQLVEVQERGLVLDERARIARELHDVVAHHVSLIAVRAETAPYRLEGLPDAAREEFGEISQVSRESLTEMRRLLGVLRSDGPPPTAPQPGLADLAELMEWIRATGTPVRLETHGSMAGLPAAVDVSAYRILQEALTNAARHATGATVRVRLQRTASDLTISVRNDPPPGRAGGGHGAPPAGEGGHGVRGMRERAAMLGGELRAGPTAGGGFEVTATLPLRGDRA